MGRWFRNFMAGRYGTDKLNMTLLVVSLVLVVLSSFLTGWLKLAAVIVAYGLMFWAVWRSLSRNTYKRYQENRKYLSILSRMKDRQHRYYNCPRCRQTVRVPRGKGKISITCPKCREKFIKKT